MNFSSLIFYTAALLFCVILTLRSERTRWFMTALFLLLPVALIIFIGSLVVQQFTEALIAFGITALLSSGWWFFLGRKLKPVESQIQVWGQDAAPKPKPGELQDEIFRLKEEKEKLEAELRKLRDNKPTTDDRR